MGAWSGLFNVSLFTLFPRIGRLFLLTMTASALSEIIDPLFPLLNDLSGYVREVKQSPEKEQ